MTGSCAEGDIALIYDGRHPFEIEESEIDTTTKLETKIKLNVGFPAKALADSLLPVDGVGLARIEFILTAEVGVTRWRSSTAQELGEYRRGRCAPAVEAPHPPRSTGAPRGTPTSGSSSSTV